MTEHNIGYTNRKQEVENGNEHGIKHKRTGDRIQANITKENKCGRTMSKF